MARLARVVVVDVAHHVTQRGNARQCVLNTDADRAVYLELLGQYVKLYEWSLWGYCLMSNHVHLITVPHRADALALMMKQAQGRFSSYGNAKRGLSGHAWQGRFYSCAMSPEHLWEALPYVELNPVRARMVARAEEWRWSSAGAHCGTAEPAAFLEMADWQQRWGTEAWRRFLLAGDKEADLTTIRQCTHTGRPLGSEEFVRSLEEKLKRQLAVRQGGRPSKRDENIAQERFSFE